MFESHDDQPVPPSGPARVVSSARTGGPDASSAPAASGPPASVSECSLIEDALGRMVDQVFHQIFVADDVLADVGRLGVGHSMRPKPGPSLAALLDAALPGPELAALLASLELSDVDDHTLVEVLAAVGGWRVSRAPAGGVTTWTAPSGHRYERPPTVADPSHHPPDEHPPSTAPPPF
jgi:hypothetical protein